ncbi:MAG: ribulokinase [Phycisphaerae bacterium]|nr:ribulokinase [Phycisphaerae bacterium]
MYYTIGLDFGTNSVRCLLVSTTDGHELGTAVYEYESGLSGILLDPADHNLARQNPADYLKGMEQSIRGAIIQARTTDTSFNSSQIVGIGVDTTGSTPIPVDAKGMPLALKEEFLQNLNAYVWLWKDHTSHTEANEITELAQKEHPEYLAKCGGIYSSEWFFSKILHCLRTDPEVYDATYTWVEHVDWITGVLTGTEHPDTLKRSRCAAGHKALFNNAWGGYPAKDFLAKLDPKLALLRETLPDETSNVNETAGYLTEDWAVKLGLKTGIPVAMGAFDCHLGAIGAGVKPGTMVKVLGTSTCDIMVSDTSSPLEDIPGVCGIVEGSVLPGYFGIEAGQSAVGDIFNWFVNHIQPGGKRSGSHETLTRKAARLMPGESGLLALDWNNGNRTVLVDQRLSGLLLGQTLHTKPEEIYRALIEATAFGALTIIKRIEEYGVIIDEVINCGGIAEKNPLLMQIYADVTNREMKVSRSSQTCALGAAMSAAVVAGKQAGGHDNFTDAQTTMSGVHKKTYKPNVENHKIYQQLYSLYKQLHDAFGNADNSTGLYNVMKNLLEIKEVSLKPATGNKVKKPILNVTEILSENTESKAMR